MDARQFTRRFLASRCVAGDDAGQDATVFGEFAKPANEVDIGFRAAIEQGQDNWRRLVPARRPLQPRRDPLRRRHPNYAEILGVEILGVLEPQETDRPEPMLTEQFGGEQQGKAQLRRVRIVRMRREDESRAPAAPEVRAEGRGDRDIRRFEQGRLATTAQRGVVRQRAEIDLPGRRPRRRENRPPASP
ncbi:hypothetical protein CVT23_03670 [Minwuia thermotolerans]|uniref:Uncharacterized protein n=1 Tax=Minwuia thermotolerans TaxID=2056226 RepID=A0A2M9G5I2_9PROT|nr:hypothetical protein CVT23_03670 [Minwuia thermotolerans]